MAKKEALAPLQRMSKEERELSDMTAAQRRKELFRALEESAHLVLRAANILRAMELAGDSLEGIPRGLLTWLRKIYARKILPEVYTEFDGTLRAHVALLPLDHQKRLVDGEKVPLLVFRGQLSDVVELDPKNMTPYQVRQVFHREGFIRDEEGQRAWIENEMLREAKKDPPPDKIRIDKKRKGLVVGSTFISAGDLANYLQKIPL